jgi:hypothetical protein
MKHDMQSCGSLQEDMETYGVSSLVVNLGLVVVLLSVAEAMMKSHHFSMRNNTYEVRPITVIQEPTLYFFGLVRAL